MADVKERWIKEYLTELRSYHRQKRTGETKRKRKRMNLPIPRRNGKETPITNLGQRWGGSPVTIIPRILKRAL